AEWFAAMLWSSVEKSPQHPRLPTPLTQHHRRAIKGPGTVPAIAAPKPPRGCRKGGTPLARGERAYCDDCRRVTSREILGEAAVKGRRASQTPEAQARRAVALRRNRDAERAWNPADQPRWLTKRAYDEQIKPRLVGVKISALISALCVSKPYAINV